MEILILTTLFSVLFAILFLVLFIRTRQVPSGSSMEQDSLIPFIDDGPVPMKVLSREDSAGRTVAPSEISPDKKTKNEQSNRCLKQCEGCRVGRSCSDNH